MFCILILGLKIIVILYIEKTKFKEENTEMLEKLSDFELSNLSGGGGEKRIWKYVDPPKCEVDHCQFCWKPVDNGPFYASICYVSCFTLKKYYYPEKVFCDRDCYNSFLDKLPDSISIFEEYIEGDETYKYESLCYKAPYKFYIEK